MGAPVHGMDTSMEPWVLQPMLGSWHPWVLPLPWDGPNNGPIDLYTPFFILGGTHGCTYPWDGHQHGAIIGAPTNVRLLAPMGAPIHGTDPTIDPLISAPHF